MPPKEFLAALLVLGFVRSDAPNDTGQSEAARLFGYQPRQVRKWVAGEVEVPPAVALCLRLMLKLKLRADKVRKLIGED